MPQVDSGDVALFCIGCSVVGMIYGGGKDRLLEGLLAGLLLGPIGLIWLGCVPARKTCAFCRKRIDGKAAVCPHCQREQQTT